MFGLGMTEIIFLGILALVVIGPKELPELARTLGRFLNELKRSTSVLGDELKQHTRFDLHDNPPPPSTTDSTVQEHSAEPEQMELSEQSTDETKKTSTNPHEKRRTGCKSSIFI